MRIAIVAGTRPEFIKLAPVANLLGPDAQLIATGQHHIAGMTDPTTGHLMLPCPSETTRGQHLAAMTSALDRTFREHHPEVVIVHGDTTSALAGALAANATDTPLVHIEAGLRSHDRGMPEEHHRILIDHLADLCCAPTPTARNNLRAENIAPDRIALTGNTIIDAVQSTLPAPQQQTELLDELGTPNTYILATIHRPENTDNPINLKTILRELQSLNAPTLLPLHPRTQQKILEHNLTHLTTGLRTPGPLDYPALLTAITHSALVITDSGGIQEEITVLKRPTLIIRRSNERPEIEGTFATRLAPGPRISATANHWLTGLLAIHRRLARLPTPFGNGTAAQQIIDAIYKRWQLPAIQ